MSEKPRISDWEDVVFGLLNEAGFFDDDCMDELFEEETRPDEVVDLDTLLDCFKENDWRCTEPRDAEPYLTFLARSPGEITYFVIYHSGEFDREEFVYQLKLGFALIDDEECQLVLFFSDDEDLCDELENEIEENFLSVSLGISRVVIRSTLP